MPGIPTLFIVRDLLSETPAGPDQCARRDLLERISAEPAYGHFGAPGVNLLGSTDTQPVFQLAASSQQPGRAEGAP